MNPTTPLSADQLPEDFQEFLTLLDEHQVRYLIGGGYAVIYHGYPRTTGDIDIFFEPSAGNTEALYNALEEFWGGTVPHVDTPEELLDELGVQFGTPPNRIDLFNTLEGVDFSEAWENREIVSLGEIEIYILDEESLIAAKKASDRDRDRQDIKFLQEQ